MFKGIKRNNIIGFASTVLLFAVLGLFTVTPHVYAAPAVTQQQGQKININTADQNALVSLKGIGVSKAKAIIEYRQQHGKFKAIADLENVPGISHKLLAKISPMITI